MKKIIFLTLIVCSSISLFSQENKGLAQVRKMSGIELYIYSEPLRDYEAVGSVSSTNLVEVLDAVNVGLKAVDGNDRASDVKCYNMNERIRIIVQNALKRKNHKKKPVDFDAIIIDDDEQGILIKFID